MSLGETGRSAGSLAILSDWPTTRPRATPAAGHDDRVAARPVVAASAVAERQLGRPAVLAQQDDQGLVEQPATIEVDQQPREGLIEARQELVLHAGEVVPVGIPAGAGQAILVPEDGDEPAAGLDEPPRGQATPGRRGSCRRASAVSSGSWPRSNARADGRRAGEVVGHRAVPVDARRSRRRGIGRAANLLELLEQRPAAVEAVEGQFRRQVRRPRSARTGSPA